MSEEFVSNTEAARRIREWLNEPRHDHFSWPTDSCGYDQHMKFVEYRNQHWLGYFENKEKSYLLTYFDFVREYAKNLEQAPDVDPKICNVCGMLYPKESNARDCEDGHKENDDDREALRRYATPINENETI